jgi:hypothetical protein
MSEIKVNKISPRTNCGTVQLGDSGDTITIPAGATITNSGTAAGFGATGAASWDTTVKTASFTGVAGVGYFVNTTSGAITVTLPASPDAGAVIAVKDYAKTFDTNNVTLARNGSNIGGEAVDATLSTEGLAVTLVYVDATQGWLVTDNGTQDTAPTAQFVTATGGTITCCGDYKIHTFTGPGTFCVSCAGNCAGSNSVDYLVVAGGGGGGMGGSAASLPGPDITDGGGGGGAGGFRESVPSPAAWTASPLANPGNARPVSVQSYPITVGSGGAGKSCNANIAPSGSVSTFSDITSAGGGGGASKNQPGDSGSGPFSGADGGSGGGASHRNSPTANSTTAGGAGNTPPVSPAQGNGGGNANNPWGNARGGGGGGATAGGLPGCHSGNGGAGATTSINGTPTARAGGGGGASGPTTGPAPINMGNGGAGGTGGGGKGSGASLAPDPGGRSAGGTNTGGGGGGANPGCTTAALGNGGSGIVIIRYKYQ